MQHRLRVDGEDYRVQVAPWNATGPIWRALRVDIWGLGEQSIGDAKWRDGVWTLSHGVRHLSAALEAMRLREYPEPEPEPERPPVLDQRPRFPVRLCHGYEVQAVASDDTDPEAPPVLVLCHRGDPSFRIMLRAGHRPEAVAEALGDALRRFPGGKLCRYP